MGNELQQGDCKAFVEIMQALKIFMTDFGAKKQEKIDFDGKK